MKAELEELEGLESVECKENMQLRRDNLLLNDEVTEMQARVGFFKNMSIYSVIVVPFWKVLFWMHAQVIHLNCRIIEHARVFP